MQDIDSVAIEKIRVAAGDKAEIVVARNEQEVIAAAPEADIIFGRITQEIFAATTKLKWVHASTAGADAYLFESFASSNALLSGDKGLVGSHLAETAFGLLLAITKTNKL